MKAKLQNILAMVIFGTIGLFVQYIPLPRAAIAAVRGLCGALILGLVLLLSGKKPDGNAIRRNLPILLLSGGIMGFNWIFLFEAYRLSSVATGTLCYYLAPVFVTLLSPLVLQEKLTARKALCVAIALMGMVPVSGILAPQTGSRFFGGVAFGVAAAAFYAGVVLLNKKLKNIGPMDRTLVQLAAAGIVPIPYLLLTEGTLAFSLDSRALLLLAVVAVVHTGLAYVLYFGSLAKLPAQSAAILSYLDPVVAILLSALVLKEQLGPLTWVGAALILGAALLGEVEFKKEKRS